MPHNISIYAITKLWRIFQLYQFRIYIEIGCIYETAVQTYKKHQHPPKTAAQICSYKCNFTFGFVRDAYAFVILANDFAPTQAVLAFCKPPCKRYIGIFSFTNPFASLAYRFVNETWRNASVTNAFAILQRPL